MESRQSALQSKSLFKKDNTNKDNFKSCDENKTYVQLNNALYNYFVKHLLKMNKKHLLRNLLFATYAANGQNYQKRAVEAQNVVGQTFYVGDPVPANAAVSGFSFVDSLEVSGPASRISEKDLQLCQFRVTFVLNLSQAKVKNLFNDLTETNPYTSQVRYDDDKVDRLNYAITDKLDRIYVDVYNRMNNEYNRFAILELNDSKVLKIFPRQENKVESKNDDDEDEKHSKRSRFSRWLGCCK